MIRIDSLTDKDVGRWVWYTPGFGAMEKGRLKSWNEKSIFVVYSCNQEWGRYKDFTAASTTPEDLQFIQHQDHCRADGGYVCACIAPDLKIEEDNFTG